MSRTKAVLILLALVFAALLGQQPAEAQPKPSSEVLLPYFEVDLQSTGVTTMFAVGNAHKQAVDIQVTVYTNWGIPISTSKVALAPNQIRSFDLRTWLTGDLPGRKLSKAEVLNFKAQLMGQAAPKDKLYYSTAVGTNLAVGYVRIKALGDPAPAALWGDYFLLNGSKTFGEGDTLVNIDESVSCSPLCSRHALRYLTSGNFDGGTQVVVWSSVAGQPSKTPAGTASVAADALAYNDAGQPIGGKQLRLLPLQVVPVTALGLGQPNGWLDFQTDSPAVIAVHHSSKSKFGIALQSYCLPEIQAPEPGLRLKKLTNGEDANVAPGPTIPVGDPVLWQYIVENNGAVRISDIVVEDDKGVAVSCPKNALEPGEPMTCTGNGIAEACQYENLGLVTGKTPTGQEVAAEDPSHYFGGQNAALDIEKLVNEQDADAAPGIEVEQGAAVSWAYVVTNSGDVALNNIKVADDDKTLTVTCPRGSLRPGESMVCTAQGKAINGAYKNVGTASAATSCGNVISDSDPAYYTGAPEEGPAIDIEKHTNGEDADAAPGPRLLIGSPVVWEYIVTNIGDTSLSAVKVTDDQGVAVTCPKATLAVSESMTCTGRGTAREGQYKNIGSVSGTSPQGKVVRDTDPSHYYGGIDDPECPAIDIEKHTNGEDADVAPGPELLPDSPVLWEYFVTNTGNTQLSNVKVTDDKGVAVSCPKTTLAAGETMRCTGTGTAQKGQYTNIGTVTGASPKGKSVRDSDPSNYFGKTCDCPAIDIEKHTNGEDADTPTGPQIEVGKPVLWEYFVTNTGKSALSNVKVTDDQGVAVSCPKTTLQPAETMRCTGNGTAKEGQYRNVGTATGASPQGQTVRDEDPSHYYGYRPEDPKIKIVKTTNDNWCDKAPGRTIKAGSQVTWKYTVTNIGTVQLNSIAVTDDKEGTISCPKTSLQPGESMTCSRTSVAVACQYSNKGTVTATSTGGKAVTASDMSWYFGQTSASIDIKKAVNGDDANSSPGPSINVGSPVTWTYTVTNTGDVALSNVQVTDNKEGAVSCPKSALQPGESMTCSKTGTAIEGLYYNTGTVTAQPPCGNAVSDSDKAYYTGKTIKENPAISLVKTTNSNRCFNAPGNKIAVGSQVTWEYTVKNTGDVRLDSIQVTDDKEGAVSCPKTSLQPGESMTCSKKGIAQACQYSNKGTVTATSTGGKAVTASDMSWYFGQTNASIDIKKAVNGDDANSSPGPSINVGSPVTWTYTVTNTGDVALSNVQVTDNKEGSVSCPKTTLNPNESMTCTKTGVAIEGYYSNIGTVTAQPPCGSAVSDSDKAYYKGVGQQASQGCTPGYWKNHTDSWRPTDYETSDKLKYVFDKSWYYQSLTWSTLLQALSFQGGSSTDGAAETLLRASVAALLNASHSGINYPRSEASVISDVNAALATKNRDTMINLASALDRDNNLGCPLN